MTLEDSYYSSIRGASAMRIRLVNNNIPTLTSRPLEGFEKANFTGFSNYNFYTNNDNTINETVKRPIGCFGFYAETPSTDAYGYFENPPTIDFSLGYQQYASKIYLFINIDKGSRLYKIDYETYIDGETFKKEDVDVTFSNDLIEIVAPEGKKFSDYFEITLKMGSPDKSINVGAIVIGDVLEVKNKDIKEASLNMSGDITGAKLTSESFETSLFDEQGIYCDKNYNIILINHFYGNQASSYIGNISPTKMLIVPNDGMFQEDATESKITKIKAIDVMSFLTALYSNQDIQNSVNDVNQIYDLIEKASLLNGLKLSLQNGLLKHENGFINNSIVISTTPINEQPYNVILQALGFIGAYVFKINNDVIEPIRIFETDTTVQTDINLSECFEKPSKKTYPIIKNATFTFTKSWIDNSTKEQIFNELPIKVFWNRGATVKLPADYHVPSPNEAGYVYIISSDFSTLKDITLSDFSYSIADGNLFIIKTGDMDSQYEDVYINVYAHKIPYSNSSISKTINDTGENLELKSDYITLPDAILNNFDETSDEIYDRIILPYSYTDEYSYNMRGRFEINLYDKIRAEVAKGVYREAIVTQHKLSYNGAYNSEITVTAIGTPMAYLYPSHTLYPSDTLYPTNEMKGVE